MPENKKKTRGNLAVMGRLVVLVSHRASTMRIADRTYSVENGRMS